MGVAFAAAHGQTHPDLDGRVDAILHRRHAEFFVVRSPFFIHQRIAMKSRGEDLFGRGVGKQVAR